MNRIRLAFPAVVLLLAVSISSAGQSLVETPGVPVVPRSVQAPAQAPVQSPAESSVIVVKPGLSDEQMADLYMARKEFREAAVTFKRLADQSPQNPVYLNKLGIALHQQAALGAALKYYERASKVDPTYADAQNNIGTIWYQRKKYGRAIKAYQKAINIRADMAVLYSNLAYAYFGDRGRFYFLLAKSFAEAGNLERCLIYLRKAKDEGYKELSEVKTDPAFAAVLKDPGIQEVLAPKPPDTPQP